MQKLMLPLQPGYSMFSAASLWRDGYSLRIGRHTAHARRYSDHDDNDHHLKQPLCPLG